MLKDKNAPIIIVGGGAWGLSTAFHLCNEGCSNVTVFERAPEVPSRYSAADDLNKIVRAEYENEFYTQLALEAIEGWKTPVFAPYYHQTGYIVATSGRAPSKAIKSLQKALESVSKHPSFASGIKALNSRKEFKDYAWQISGPLNGFKGYFNRLAGYAHSANALKGLYTHLAGRGVKFLLGEAQGKVTELIYSDDDAPRRCLGVRTAEGSVHYAQTTICALGAYGASLIPELGTFNVARSWSVAHVQLTESECDMLRGLPVINVRDLGFFFEPDPATRLFKLCPLGAGYNNPNPLSGVSLPPPDELPQPQDFIPVDDELKLRTLLRETFPWMADRPFVNQKLCWFSDTRDSDFCIDFVPDTSESLVVLSGDSGHGFKMMPVFGKWVVDLLAAGRQHLARWQWRAESPGGHDWANEVSWRIGKAKELKELIEERNNMLRARL